jgi:serine/threonine-protein kinase
MTATPYVIGQWVRGEKFYGRTRLIEEILEGPRDWIWLLGTRRYGKTSLLKQVEHLASPLDGSAYFPLFWDFQGAEDSDELNRGFQEALLDAEERIEEHGFGVEDVEGGDLFDSLNKLRRKLRPSGKKLLLLCDEVEELIKLNRKDPSLLRKLRRAMQSREGIRSVLASTIRLWELSGQESDTSPFLHGFAPPLYIARLTDDEARALVRQSKLPDDSRPRLLDADIETIRSRCDNHPYLMQLVAKRTLEMGDVAEALETVAGDRMVSFFFAVDFEMLSSSERSILRSIAATTAANSNSIQDHLGLSQEQMNAALHRLENLGYVRRNAERRYELANWFFRSWFKEQGALSPLPPSASIRPEDKTTEAAVVSDGLSQVLFDGRYRLLEELGRGATGRVYKAHDEVGRETIAIKILKPEYSSDPSAMDRVRGELVLARDLNHPNILKMYYLGDAQGQKYLTMRWLSGPTLAHVIARESPIPSFRILTLATPIVSALEAAHAKNVLHRDIKPQNIILDENGVPCVTDFGLARLLGGPGITASGVFVGTPDYASPEQANLKPLDARSDLYSFGIVLFELATGRRPFRADAVGQVLEMHRTAPVPDPRSIRPEIPERLSRLILRCLEKDPNRRFPNARELVTALKTMRVA